MSGDTISAVQGKPEMSLTKIAYLPERIFYEENRPKLVSTPLPPQNQLIAKTSHSVGY
jgi:hypothetical protein